MMTKKKKITLWAILLIIILPSLFLVFSKYELNKKRIDTSEFFKPQNLLSLEAFSKILDSEESFEVSVYYIGFPAKFSHPPLQEGHVFAISHLKLELKYFNAALQISDFFSKVLNNIKILEESSSLYPDYRFSCLIKSKSGKYLRFSISRNNPNIIFVNDKIYSISSELFDGVLGLLPKREYKEAIEYLKTSK